MSIIIFIIIIIIIVIVIVIVIIRINISIGNHMDESVISEKIALQQKNCTRQSRVLFELLQVQIFPKIALWSMGLFINHHDLP